MTPTRIQELGNWPPHTFQNDRRKVLVTPPEPGRLVLTSVDYLSGPRPEDPHSEIVIGLLDPVTHQWCTTRLGIPDVALALRVYQTLRGCEKMTLDQVADRPLVAM